MNALVPPEDLHGLLSSAFVGALILGAGKSARMGRPKLLLPWHGTTILGHLIQQWKRLSVEQIAVVENITNCLIHCRISTALAQFQ